MRDRVYRVSPWRRWVLWYTMGPILLFFLICAAVAPASAEPLLLCSALMILIAAPIEWIIRRTKLVLNAEGVVLRQAGYRLETSWANVIRLRLDRGREGFILASPLEGKGAHRLASFRGASMNGAPMYDGEQQQLLAERRFIPFEAFAWHLRRGRLRADLEDFAPHLQPMLATLDAPPPRPAPRTLQEQMRGQLVIAIVVASLGLGVFLALAPPGWSRWFFGSIDAVLAPLLTLSTGYSAWSCLRARAWIIGSLLILMTVLMAGWTIVAWERAAQLIR